MVDSFGECPVCRGLKNELIFKRGSHGVRKCLSCGFGWLIGEKDISYDRQYFKDRFFDNFEKDALCKLIFIKNHVGKDLKILDFGCGLGDFLNLAKKDGFDVVGYDSSSYVKEYVLEKYGIKILSSRLRSNLFRENSFDCIVIFDVLEHLPNFKLVLGYLHRWLNAGGKIVITTPNLESWDARLLGKYWYGFRKIPEHVNYFSPSSIRKVLSETGFKDISVLSWGFNRDLGFVLSKLSALSRLPKFLNNFSFFVPAVEMLVIARK